MAYTRTEQRILEEESEKKKKKKAARKAGLLKANEDNLEMLDKLKGETPRSKAAAKAMSMGMGPLRPEVAQKAIESDQKSLESQQKSSQSQQLSKTAAKKKVAKQSNASKMQAAGAIAQESGNEGLGNIASGAATGAAVAGPWGAVAGAALGGLKNLSAQKKKKKQLAAQAIMGQADAFNQASQGEREALQNIIEGFRSALIFGGGPF